MITKGRHCSVREGKLEAECDNRAGRGRGLTTMGRVPQCLSKETRAGPVTVTWFSQESGSSDKTIEKRQV